MEYSEMTLEQLREYEALLVAEQQAITEELVWVRDEIAKKAAEESDNEYWDLIQEEAGTLSYSLKPLKAAYELFRNGDRAEYHYSYAYAPFGYRYIATLTDDVSPVNRAHYVRASNANFAKLIIWNVQREGPILAQVYDEDNIAIEGLKIPYASSVEGGVRYSTLTMREYWEKDSTIQFHRRKAGMLLRRLDREYLLARIRGTLDEFNAEYPYFVPEDQWNS